MRVLWVKTSSLGDVVHALYALTEPVFAARDIDFDWLVEADYASVPALSPAVDRVIPVHLRAWLRSGFVPRWARVGWRGFRESIREREYDLVIDAQGLLKSAFPAHRAARWAGCELTGPDRASARESLAARFYHRDIAVPHRMHAVDRLRVLLARALSLPEPDLSAPTGSGITAATGGGTVLLLHGSSSARKLWPIEHWIALSQMLQQRDHRVALTWGSDKERMRAQTIAGESGAELWPGVALAALLPRLGGLAGFVGTDSGLAQLCAALGCPGVTLYGPSDPALTGTRGQRQRHLWGDLKSGIQPRDVCLALPF